MLLDQPPRPRDLGRRDQVRVAVGGIGQYAEPVTPGRIRPEPTVRVGVNTAGRNRDDRAGDRLVSVAGNDTPFDELGGLERHRDVERSLAKIRGNLEDLHAEPRVIGHQTDVETATNSATQTGLVHLS